jgi:GAF domain-containing protein
MDLDPKVLEVVQRPSRLRALATVQANAESAADALDRITRIACRALEVPVAIVNLIGAEGQTFLGCGSLPEPWKSMKEMPLDAGWCPFALDVDRAYAFADARTEPGIADNPAARSIGVVAYAGVPLRTAGGEPVGTLCALDYEPHEWTEDELALMTDLAASAVAELQLLGASRLVKRSHDRWQRLGTVSAALAETHSPAEVLDTVIGALERTDAGVIWRSSGDAVARPARLADDAPLDPERVARQAEPLFLSSRQDVREAFGRDVPEIGSAALLPVRAGNERLGVLGACFPYEHDFSEDERDYLEALAGITGLALARS